MSRILRNYVDGLDVAAEERVLGETLSPFYFNSLGNRCLIGSARNCHEQDFATCVAADPKVANDTLGGVGTAFDAACRGRGVALGVGFHTVQRDTWVNRAIKNRIRANRARRAAEQGQHPEPSPRNLTERPELVHAIAH